MQVQLKNWGNSQGIRFSKEFRFNANLCGEMCSQPMRKYFPKEGKQVEKLFPVPFMAFSEGGVGETALWPPKSGFPHKLLH